MSRDNRGKIIGGIALFCFCMVIILSGCLGNEDEFGEEDTVGELSKSPIKIYIGSDINSHTAGGRVYHFSNLIESYLEENLPEYEIFLAFEMTVTGNYLSREILFEEEWGKNDEIEPDIIIDYPHQIPFLLEVEHLEFDKVDFSEIYDIDLSRFDSRFLEQIMAMGDGTLYAFPFVRSLHALKYNKLAFDEYGIDYPEGEVTWQEVEKWGEILPPWSLNIDPKLLLHQLSSTYVDALQEKHQDMWLDIGTLFTNYEPYPAFLHNRGRWTNHHHVIRLFSTDSGDYFLPSVEWDMIAFPTFPGRDREGPDRVVDMIAVTPYTDNIEGAFEVVKLLLSDDFQRELSKLGHGSPLRDAQVHQHFGENVLYYEGKDVSYFFRNSPSKSGIMNEQERIAEELALPYLMNISRGMDMEEAIEEMLAAYKEASSED